MVRPCSWAGAGWGMQLVPCRPALVELTMLDRLCCQRPPQTLQWPCCVSADTKSPATHERASVNQPVAAAAHVFTPCVVPWTGQQDPEKAQELARRSRAALRWLQQAQREDQSMVCGQSEADRRQVCCSTSAGLATQTCACYGPAAQLLTAGSGLFS